MKNSSHTCIYLSITMATLDISHHFRPLLKNFPRSQNFLEIPWPGLSTYITSYL